MGRECPEAVLPDMALYFPTFSHLLIVNKLLSLSPLSPLSLSLSHDGSRNLMVLVADDLTPICFLGTQRRRLISRQEIHLRQARCRLRLHPPCCLFFSCSPHLESGGGSSCCRSCSQLLLCVCITLHIYTSAMGKGQMAHQWKKRESDLLNLVCFDLCTLLNADFSYTGK
jgi:hypothetical protein